MLQFEQGIEPRRSVLERMTEALAHRGPDERGIWAQGPVGLGVRRLRIVDLTTGQQPLTNEDGRICLVANGEIYNADELRVGLRRRGHVFSSGTDTEVILHLYEEEGPACLERLEGMFAFALWDVDRRRLFLARDRFGEKPLYYARLQRAFVFASELKALLHHPEMPRDLDWEAVARYLTLDYVPSPLSVFGAIRKLPPAHWMQVGVDGSERVGRYWELPVAGSLQPTTAEAAERVLDLLRASVADRIKCDVPWGTFLSGGLDSSLVTGLAATISSRPVKTFAVGFDEPTYDERSAGADVGRFFGTDHHEIVLHASQARELLPEVARIFDEPFADPSVIPTVLLSRLARRDVTMVLSGDGADELFCGYPTQVAHAAADVYQHLPAALRRGIVAGAALLPTSHRYLSFDFALRRFVRDAHRPVVERHLRWMGSFAPEMVPRVLAPDVRRHVAGHASYADLAERMVTLGAAGTSATATTLDIVLYLAEDNLVQVDRAAMSAALEVRAPFLDRRLAEYALALPAAMRRGLWRAKPLLRRAARSVLPREVRNRPKHGFGVPTGAWLMGQLRDVMADLLAPELLRRQGVFDAEYVGAMRDRHLRGVANHRKELWTLLMFQLWMLAYCGS